jgi:hypothetical protein
MRKLKGSTGWTTGDRLPAGTRTFSPRYLVQTGSGTHPAPIQWVLGLLSQGWGHWGVNLTTHFYLVPRLMRGAIPALPQYVFTAWCLIKKWTTFVLWYLGIGTTLLLPVPHISLYTIYEARRIVCRRSEMCNYVNFSLLLGNKLFPKLLSKEISPVIYLHIILYIHIAHILATIPLCPL